MTFKTLLTGALAAGTAMCGLAAASFAGQYDGITIHIMTRPGKVIAQRLVDRGQEFTKATGQQPEHGLGLQDPRRSAVFGRGSGP